MTQPATVVRHDHFVDSRATTTGSKKPYTTLRVVKPDFRRDHRELHPDSLSSQGPRTEFVETLYSFVAEPTLSMVGEIAHTRFLSKGFGGWLDRHLAARAVSGIDSTFASERLLWEPHTVDSVIDDVNTEWPLVAERLREIEESLREDYDRSIEHRSLSVLSRLFRSSLGVPQPRIGAGDDGTLDAVWRLEHDGIFVAEFLVDGMVGCAAVLDTEERSHSETLTVDQASAALRWLAALDFLKRG